MEHTVLHLQPRLQCLADLVPAGAKLVDVGTDHGYLPVWLVQRGHISRAIASDINEAPLRHARETAARCGVTDRIDFRLCSGLDAVAPHEADTVVIAGMGAETSASVLSAAACDCHCSKHDTYYRRNNSLFHFPSSFFNYI